MSQDRTKRTRGDVDPVLQDAQETDIVIPIMGATGAGKSSFINLLLDAVGHSRRRVKVGDQLASCTSDIEAVVIGGQIAQGRARFINITENQRLVVVDTPGFDDTTASDFEILRRIAQWLQESLEKKMILGGVIYLHDISQDRFSGTARRNLDMFMQLCGQAALDKVVLVTSKWSRLGSQSFANREKELKDVHWKELLQTTNGAPGAHVMRLNSRQGEAKGAWDVIHHILEKLDKRMTQSAIADVLQIQDELVKKKKRIPGTRAAKKLREQLEAALRVQEEMLTLEAQAANGDRAAQEQIREKEARLREMHAAIQANRVSFFSRFAFLWRRWF